MQFFTTAKQFLVLFMLGSISLVWALSIATATAASMSQRQCEEICTNADRACSNAILRNTWATEAARTPALENCHDNWTRISTACCGDGSKDYNPQRAASCLANAG